LKWHLSKSIALSQHYSQNFFRLGTEQEESFELCSSCGVEKEIILRQTLRIPVSPERKEEGAKKEKIVSLPACLPASTDCLYAMLVARRLSAFIFLLFSVVYAATTPTVNLCKTACSFPPSSLFSSLPRRFQTPSSSSSSSSSSSPF
jgi:hypothetical protein